MRRMTRRRDWKLKRAVCGSDQYGISYVCGYLVEGGFTMFAVIGGGSRSGGRFAVRIRGYAIGRSEVGAWSFGYGQIEE